MTEDNDGPSEFSVYWWDPQDNYHKEAEFVTAKAAMDTVTSMMQRKPAMTMGVFQRIIITDGGDCTVFDWNITEGVVWPTEQQVDEAGLRRHDS